MKCRIPTAALIAVMCAACAGTSSDKVAPVEFSQEKMMANWTVFMTPGPEHKVLESKVGKWDVDVTMFNPDGTRESSKGTSEISWLMDGRFLQETVNGTFGPMPFTGRGTTAYDNMKKRYVSTWIDNMGTGIMTAEGSWNPSSKTFSYTGEMPDMIRGEYVTSRSSETHVDANHWKVEMWGPGPDGKEMKMMELRYTRKS